MIFILRGDAEVDREELKSPRLRSRLERKGESRIENRESKVDEEVFLV